MHSKVMTIANRLVKQGYNRANAMIKAWVLVRMPLVETKVAGVTYGKRQKAIERHGDSIATKFYSAEVSELWVNTYQALTGRDDKPDYKDGCGR